MPELLLCTVEDTFLVTGRGLIIAPMFPVSEFQFDSNQQVRVVRPNGEAFECRSHFQIPFQSPPAKILSFVCALLGVGKEQVPIGSQVWLLGKTETDVKVTVTPYPEKGAYGRSALAGDQVEGLLSLSCSLRLQAGSGR